MRYCSTPAASWPIIEVLGSQSSRTVIADALTAPRRSIAKAPRPIVTSKTTVKAMVTLPPIELKRIDFALVRMERSEKLRKLSIVVVFPSIIRGRGNVKVASMQRRHEGG